MFFQNASLEMLFMEAIANSLDANASNIQVDISIDALDKPDTLRVIITDNGEGFTDERYKKFSKLLKVDDDTHKGVGRLVYLNYFDRIVVSSKYDGNHRTFTYDNDFDEDHSDMTVITMDEQIQETSLQFENCSLGRLSSYNVIFPQYLKDKVIGEFFF